MGIDTVNSELYDTNDTKHLLDSATITLLLQCNLTNATIICPENATPTHSIT